MFAPLFVFEFMAAVRPRIKLAKYYTITNVPEIAPLSALVDQFVSSRVDNKNTEKAYSAALKYFEAHCFANDCKQYADVTKKLVSDFKESRLLLESPASVALRLRVVKAFCAWVQERYSIFNPTRGVKIDDLSDDRGFKGLTDEEYRALWRAAKSQSDPLRRFLPILLVETGLRNSEARDITIGQIDLDQGWLKYVLGKGRKRRHISINDRLAPELQLYLAWRESLPAADGAPLLCSRRRSERRVTKLDNKTIWQICRDVAGTNPHSCRHTFAYRRLDALISEFTNKGHSSAGALWFAIRNLKKEMGHSSFQTTLKYLQLKHGELADAFAGELL